MNKGYKIVKKKYPNELLKTFVINLNKSTMRIPSMNVFITENNELKHLQNFNLLTEYKSLSDFIQKDLRYKVEVINIQYFIEPQGYKIALPNQGDTHSPYIKDDALTFWISLPTVKIENSCMNYLPYPSKGILEYEPYGKVTLTRNNMVGCSVSIKDSDLSMYEPVELDFGDAVVPYHYLPQYYFVNENLFNRVDITCIIKSNKSA